MKRKPATHSHRKGARPPAELPEVDVGDDSLERIVARPDGYHWLSPDARQEFGPFESVDEARINMQAIDEGVEGDAPEALLEAERGVGIADWIDPETGEPAEGQSTPHLVEE
jgi:hypothetical protein